MDNYEVSFQLILNAGNAKSKAITAIEEARNFNFEKAEQLVSEAKKDLRLAHDSHARLIQKEASGEKTEVNALFVHAEDHLSSAMLLLDLAEEFIHLYKLFNQFIEGGVRK